MRRFGVLPREGAEALPYAPQGAYDPSAKRTPFLLSIIFYLPFRLRVAFCTKTTCLRAIRRAGKSHLFCIYSAFFPSRTINTTAEATNVTTAIKSNVLIESPNEGISPRIMITATATYAETITA